MPHHGVLVIRPQIRNQVFRAIFWQRHRIRRDHNQPKGLVRPKGAALKLSDPFDYSEQKVQTTGFSR